MTEREKMIEKFCDESKSLGDAFKKIAEWDKENGNSLNGVYIDADVPEEARPKNDYVKRKSGQK